MGLSFPSPLLRCNSRLTRDHWSLAVREHMGMGIVSGADKRPHEPSVLILTPVSVIPERDRGRGSRTWNPATQRGDERIPDSPPLYCGRSLHNAQPSSAICENLVWPEWSEPCAGTAKNRQYQRRQRQN